MASRGNACPLIIDAKASLLDKELLRPWLSKPQVTNMFRNYFPETPTHFNQLHYMVMRNVLVRTGCGRSDAQVRELLTFMAELGIVQFKDDLVWVPTRVATSRLANQTR